jgi:predicted nuclease with TOPRIM domain
MDNGMDGYDYLNKKINELEKENVALKEGNTFNLNLISQLNNHMDELNLQVNQLKRKLKEAKE